MSSASSPWTSAAANAHTTLADTFTDEMEDPSLANNLLFELSESEDDYEDEWSIWTKSKNSTVVEFLFDENFTFFTEQMNEIKSLIQYAMIWG